MKSAGFEKVRLAEEDEKECTPHPGFLNRQDILVNRDILDGIVRTQQRRIEIPVGFKTIPNVVRDVETVVSGLLKRANVNAMNFRWRSGPK